MNDLRHLKKIIIIAGPARSGTSILGKILGSCKNTEYWYEPETFQYISTLYNKISKKIWKILFERYITENLLRLITGRSINFKKNENSSIFDLKSKKEIKKKLQNKLSELDLNDYLKKNQVNLIIKSPSVELNYLMKIFPKYKIIFTLRDHYEVINSLIKRKWFRNKNYLKTFLPSVRIKNHNYPLWMKKKYLKFWNGSNEETKCAIYLLYCYDEARKFNNIIYFKYKESIDYPEKSSRLIIKKLGLKLSDQTLKIIKKVRKPKSSLQLKRNEIRNKINPKVLSLLEKIKT